METHTLTTGSILKQLVEINRLSTKQRFEISKQTVSMILELQHAKYECVLCKKYRKALLEVLARVDVFGVEYAMKRNKLMDIPHVKSFSLDELPHVDPVLSRGI